MSGKGSKPRPVSIPADEFARRSERVFGVDVRRVPRVTHALVHPDTARAFGIDVDALELEPT
jgi:hypothetical protein